MAFNEDSLTVVDVTKKASPVMLSRTPYYGVRYCHQGWLSENQAYVFLDDELDEMYKTYDTTGKTVTYIVDVSSLTEPRFIGVHQAPVVSIDHNMYVEGNHIYQSNYASGLRVLGGACTVVSPSTLQADQSSDQEFGDIREVAFFDVHPEGDVDEFFGTWSNYPYYTSSANRDTIVVQSIERGLFILRFPTLSTKC